MSYHGAHRPGQSNDGDDGGGPRVTEFMLGRWWAGGCDESDGNMRTPHKHNTPKRRHGHRDQGVCVIPARNCIRASHLWTLVRFLHAGPCQLVTFVSPSRRPGVQCFRVRGVTDGLLRLESHLAHMARVPLYSSRPPPRPRRLGSQQPGFALTDPQPNTTGAFS